MAKIITIKTQKAWDKLPKEFVKDTIIQVKSLRGVCISHTPKNSRVEIHGYSSSSPTIVTVCNNAIIYTYDDTSVRAKDDSVVFSMGDGGIIAENNSSVILHGQAEVGAWHTATVMVHGNGNFEAMNKSVVTFHDGMEVHESKFKNGDRVFIPEICKIGNVISIMRNKKFAGVCYVVEINGNSYILPNTAIRYLNESKLIKATKLHEFVYG